MKQILRLTMALVALLALAGTPSFAKAPEVLVGEVVGVIDGDTLDLLVDKHEVRVRLANVDAPEKKQPYGHEAKTVLSEMAFGKQCTATVQTTDRYKRKVSVLYCDDVEINRLLVEHGSAWVYPQYNRDDSLPVLQEEAQAAERGLWALPKDQRVAPWLWRHPKASEPPLKPMSKASGCATLKCSDLHSCADALNALQRCPKSRLLDGDKDGVPCEGLCGK